MANAETYARWAVVMLATLLLAAVSAQAQIHGVPPSLTSLGGFHTIDNPPGVPASVTSLGPNGFSPSFGMAPTFRINHRPGFDGRFDGRFHGGRFDGFGSGFGLRRRVGGFVPVYVPYYPVYGGYAGYDTETVQQPIVVRVEDDRPAPTIFEHRERRAEDDSRYGEHYIDSRERAQQPAPKEAPKIEPSEPATPTLLVFQDGHKTEVLNYAIMGETLMELSGTKRRKFLLAELDIPATVKANDERGVDFRLPRKK